MRKLKIIKFLTVIVILFVCSKSDAKVEFEQLKGMYNITSNELFDPVNGFLALETGTLKRIRFYGPYVLDNKENPSSSWRHPAFLPKPQNDPYAFSKRFEYPLDAISALVQWLFPSVDGVVFVANDRSADPVGFLGNSLKSDPKPFGNLLKLIYQYSQKPIPVGSFKQAILNIIPKDIQQDGKKIDTGTINQFAEILYNALFQDGTFGKRKAQNGPLDYKHDPLYPKNIALHALLGYIPILNEVLEKA